MNEYDSNRIKDFTKKIGYLSTTKIDEANCFVLNTCHIREKATEKVHHEVGRVKKKFRNKEKPIVLIVGCVAQAEGDLLLMKEKYIDAVIGPQSYHNINDIILAIESKKKIKLNYTEFDVINKFDEINLNKNTDSKVSTFLSIQEGCDKFCKFCVVPYTRGPEYSRSLDEILKEAKQLVDNGSKEIILLGQNVNAYKYNNKRLSDLLFALEKILGLQRIRYTTSHPKDLTQDLIEAHGDCKKLMPILHLPVQSGSSRMLKLMNRNHTIEEYLKLIEKLKIKKPTMKFSSDFIIAYPGETDKDFEKTVQLMKEVKFINSYSFVFSPRPGTPAATLKEIDGLIAKKRLAYFQNTSNDVKSEYRNQLVNTIVNVLFENKVKDENKYFGRDEHFNSVIVESNTELSGVIKKVKINNCNQNTLFGEVVSASKKVEYAA
tara:strand:+ start:6566 stop:7864 length:1299 start_codon:yes stop_codon:yes gene_type:complete